MRLEELRQLIDSPDQRRQVAALELAQACLQRLEACQPAVNALITSTPDIALADARNIDQIRAAGRRLPLDGMPIVVKDNMDVAGVRTTAGSRLFPSTPAVEDAEAVRRLRAAGAVVLGKTNLHELAFGSTTANPTAPFGPCRNPWDPSRSAGGSSSGSAVAVALDGCVGGVGSDTGGSVRIPAALTGITGIRPTYGRVSTRGVIPLSPSFDSVGPVARSAEEAGRLLAAMEGYDSQDPWATRPPSAIPEPADVTDASLSGLRVGVAEGFVFDGIETEIAAAVQRSAGILSDLGAEVRTLQVPASEEVCASIATLIRAEAFALYRERYEAHPELFSDEIRDRFQLAVDTTGWRVADALNARTIWQHETRKLFEGVDVILSPTTRMLAPLLDRPDSIETTWQLTYLTYPWSFAHVPAIALPCGISRSGLPISVQLAAGAWRDELLVAVGRAFQAVTSWHLSRPSDPCPGAGRARDA